MREDMVDRNKTYTITRERSIECDIQSIDRKIASLKESREKLVLELEAHRIRVKK
jgi:hypothetical protein